MKSSELAGRHVAVWGAGREGRAVHALLSERRMCRSVVLVDDRIEADGVLTGAAGRAALAAADVIVKSPGISRYRDDVVALAAAGARFTSVTDLVLSDRKGRRTVAVTGTKGKSTTSSLLHHLLVAAGLDAGLAGNIGVPAVELLEPHTRDRWVVLEVSSFQASDVETSPAYGALTSLYPEHLDWHGSLDRYYEDKLNLFRHDGLRRVVVNGANAEAVARTTGLGRRRVLASVEEWASVLGSSVLVGEANRTNAAVALTLARLVLADAKVRSADAGDEDDRWRRALASFRGLEHRLERIGNVGGFVVIDDVLATTPYAVVAGLDATASEGPLVLLCGGHDRGLDLEPLVGALRRRALAHPTAVVATGPAGTRLVGLLGDSVEAVVAGDLADAVRRALDAAERLGGEGVLLFSPGAPSFDEFDDYRARSAAFRALLGLPPASDAP